MSKFKRSLALLTVMAMVLTMFVGVASAAEEVRVEVDGDYYDSGTDIDDVIGDIDKDEVDGEEVVIKVYEGDYDGFTVPAILNTADKITIVAVDGADDTVIEGAVVIEADNVVLDGFTVEGDGFDANDETYVGIQVNGENVTVENCVVTDFGTGIEVNADKALIENNEILDNFVYGINANMDEDWVVRIRNNVIENAEEDKDYEEGNDWPVACINIEADGAEDVTAYISGNDFIQVESHEVSIKTDGSDDDDYKNYITINLKNNTFDALADDDEVEQRLAGDDRYETAVEISKEGWKNSDVVVLARGDDFADALAGTVLAASEEAPILLTRTDELPDVVADEIERLWAKEVFILGGENAISEDVEDQLEDLGIDKITRIAGDDRFETALAIAEELDDDFEFTEAVIVNGLDFPDALAAGPLAAALDVPILLTYKDELPDATADALEDDFEDLENIIIIGGRAVVSADLYEELLDDYEVERLYGDDRFETAVEVAEYMIDEDLFDEAEDPVFIANGLGFADALAGGALAAHEDGVIILTRKDRNPDCVVDFMEEYNFDAEEDIFFLGGEAVLEDGLITDFGGTDFSSVDYGADEGKIGDEEEVDSLAELEAALADDDVGIIVFENAITGDVTVGDADYDKDSLTIDGNGMALIGNLTIDADNVTVEDLTVSGNLEVNGDNFTSTNNHITGTVVVNGENAEFNTEIDGDVTVSGTGATFTNVTFGANVTVAADATATIEDSTIAGDLTVNGTLVITGDVEVTGTVTGVENITYTAVATALEVATEPAATRVDTAVTFTTAPVINIVDQFGEVVDDDSTVITVEIKTNDADNPLTLTAGTTATAANGVATFDALEGTLADTTDATGVVLTFTSDHDTPLVVDSAQFNIGTAAP